MADPDSCPWSTLQPDLVARIAHNLSPNEAACTLRRVNKSTKTQFQACITVRLSQPVPHHAFVRRWRDELSVHGLTLRQRKQLLCLTARSGVIANLEVAVAAVGCALADWVFDAAAEGGHVVVCIWLLDRGCPRDAREAIRCAARCGHTAVVRWLLEQSPRLAGRALIAAAGAGQRALCEELLAATGPKCIIMAACEAAEGGHVELTEWLLGQVAETSDEWNAQLLNWTAYGFELPVLQRLYHSRLGSKAPPTFEEKIWHRLALAALASPTPDWRPKVEWLEAVGCRLYRKDSIFNVRLIKRGDAVERVVLLRERGLMDVHQCLRDAVVNASLPVIRYLRSEGLLTGAVDDDRMERAIEGGDLAVLAELLAAGGTVWPRGVYVAARCGHLHVLRWLEGSEAGSAAAAALQEALQNAALAESGARSGSLELMEWLWERGCPMGKKRVVTAAAGAGNVALLERVVARGCPMSCGAYLVAGRNGDLATLRCLRGLDCPWGPGCTTFDRAVHGDGLRCSLEVLRWLVAEGCPVDWKSARWLAEPGGDGVMAWVKSHIPQA